MTIEQHSAPPSESTGLRAPSLAPVSAGETVFSVLGEQARSRSRSGLWTTVVGGVLNAGVVWILAKASRADTSTDAADALAEMRGLMAVVGTGAAVWAVAGFLLFALGNWH